MKGNAVALTLFGAAVAYALFTVYQAPDSVSSVTLYGANGQVETWQAKGRVKANGPGCSFTTADGREIAISGTYVIQRQR